MKQQFYQATIIWKVYLLILQSEIGSLDFLLTGGKVKAYVPGLGWLNLIGETLLE